MKILKGSLKGRNIACPSHIRPVALRVRKACFDILRDEINNKCVLDLFAGSGSLGLEALSQGAKEVVFVDIKQSCLDVIRKNLIAFKLMPQSKVYCKDAIKGIKDFFVQGSFFDIVFLDPPYYNDMKLRKALQTLENCDIVAPCGLIIGFCSNKDSFLEESSKFSLLVKRKYGQTLLLIYKKNTDVCEFSRP